MTNGISGIIQTGLESWGKGTELMERLLSRAGAASVFSEPVSQGEYTVVTAAESTVALGFGCGSGGGSAAGAPAGAPGGDEGAAPAGSDSGEGGGSGGGAGGSALSRPVAAISIGPHGVSVEPIVDPTKIALAFFTMIGAFLLMLGRMRRASRQ